MGQPHLSVVIPAYNEALRIGSSLESIRKYSSAKMFPVELIVVDDGSTDEMPALIENLGGDWPALRVFRNEPNQGKGASVRRGFLEARGTYVLFTDADLSAPMEETDKLFAAMESTAADVAIGSRALDRNLIGVRQPLWRDLGGRMFNRLVRIFTGLAIRDTQCGLKLFRRDTARPAFQLQRIRGFGFDVEVLFLINRLGGRITEVPVRWNNNPATKVRFLRDSVRMLCDLIRIRWWDLMGTYAKGARTNSMNRAGWRGPS
ncbi:MAG: dolichyl-phosphate beta-glucosyltransferase [Terriglobia bacterium]